MKLEYKSFALGILCGLLGFYAANEICAYKKAHCKKCQKHNDESPKQKERKDTDKPAEYRTIDKQVVDINSQGAQQKVDAFIISEPTQNAQ